MDWNAFRWSRITLLSDPAAKLTRMKVYVLSGSTLRGGVLKSRSIQELGNEIGGCMELTRICRKIDFGSPRSAIHLARTIRCFYYWQQEAFSGILATFRIFR